MSDWVNETLYGDWGQRFAVIKTIADENSAFQQIRIVETASHGKVLLLDGTVQLTEADEFVYQEMISHVPLLAHGAARRVLIIGAGDGGVLRRVLEHRDVQRVVMVEIDGAVMRLAREHLPDVGGNAWTDPRATVIEGDGAAYVASTEADAFDIIIVDSTDPVGVGEGLFSSAFYADCHRVLGPSGILVNQGGVPFMQPNELKRASSRQASAFRTVTAYVIAVPTYVGGLMCLGFATDRQDASNVSVEILTQRARACGVLGQTRYWSPGVHVAAFQLPPYISVLLHT